MSYPPQHGHYPNASGPQPYGWYPPPAPYPPPQRKRPVGLIVGVVATVVLLAAFGITGFAAPGFLLGDETNRTAQDGQPERGESQPKPVPVERAKDRDSASVTAALAAARARSSGRSRRRRSARSRPSPPRLGPRANALGSSGTYVSCSPRLRARVTSSNTP